MSTATLPRGTSAPALQRIALDLVDVADNVRSTMDPDALEQLASSIRESGLLQPVTVVEKPDGRYEVRFGHRRTEACRRAGLGSIDAIVVEASDAGDRLVDQLLENIQREDLNPLDEARALRRILDADKGLTQAALAARLGWADSTVSNRLRILELAKPVQQLVAEGRLSASHAKVLAGFPKGDQEAIARQAVERSWSSHDLEERGKWEVQNRQRIAADERDRAKKREQVLASVLAGLAKRGVSAGATLAVNAGYSGNDQGLVKALGDAGFKVLTLSGYQPPAPAEKYCDCTSYMVVADWNGASIQRHCGQKKHRDAEIKADTARMEAKHARAEADRKAAAATVAASLAAHPLDRPFAELLLWQLLGWNRDEWARRDPRHLVQVNAATPAKGKKADPWKVIRAMSDVDLHAAIAARVPGHEAPAGIAEASA